VTARLRPGLGAAWLVTLLVVGGCAPATNRPRSGAAPNVEVATPTPPIPPTLSASDPRFKPVVAASPGAALAASPAASPAPSPTPNPAPPIVRTVQPAAGAVVPEGGSVAVAATLVGRGADLDAASLTVDGAGVGAVIDRSDARTWTIRAAVPPAPGPHTARVQVRDSTGALGGFTWQFTVGSPQPTPAPTTAPAPEVEEDGDAERDDGQEKDDERAGQSRRDRGNRERDTNS
jgi:hypothetical protein